MTSLIYSLRKATEPHHQALHTHPLLAPLAGEITLDDFKWCIRGFYAAYQQISQSLQFESSLWQSVPALRWLESDMKIHRIQAIDLPPKDHPAASTYSQMLGLAYVTQGSTLGGTVISRYLSSTLGLVAGHTNHFFAGFGAETGARWKRFLHLLEDDNIEHRECVNQAVATFTCITHYCDEAFRSKMAASQSPSCGYTPRNTVSKC